MGVRIKGLNSYGVEFKTFGALVEGDFFYDQSGNLIVKTDYYEGFNFATGEREGFSAEGGVVESDVVITHTKTLTGSSYVKNS